MAGLGVAPPPAGPSGAATTLADAAAAAAAVAAAGPAVDAPNKPPQLFPVREERGSWHDAVSEKSGTL